MVYCDIIFNPKKIKKISGHCKLTYKQVRAQLNVDKEHFAEKDNWYLVDGIMQYFKQRGDARVLGELLSDEILRLHGFVPAKYRLVNMNGSNGLLSPNVQKKGYKYESIATFHKLMPDFVYLNKSYDDISLRDILKFIGENVPNGQELQVELIRKYVMDWFTNQLDSNVRNIIFEQDKNGNIHLSDFIDNESAFGVTKKGLDTTLDKIWVPAIPYEDKAFRTGPYKAGGVDVNIFSLLLDYPEVVIPLLKKFSDTNYDKTIAKYKKSSASGIYLPQEGIDYLKHYIESRQKESDKIRQVGS